MNLGYGSDIDSWMVAENAEKIWESQSYQKSRSMGFPLHELVTAPLVHFGGWLASNLASLAAGLCFVIAILALVRNHSLRHPMPVFLILAFHPLVIISSTTTMDYIWATAALAWAYVALVCSRPIQTGILIGLAAGFRPTSLLFAIPAILWFVWQRKWRSAMATSLATLITAGLVLSPLFVSDGALTTDLSSAQFPSELSAKELVWLVGYNLTFAIGIPQTLWVMGVIGVLLWSRQRRRKVLTEQGELVIRFHLTAIAIWLGLFLALPVEPEYLLPILLSVILLCDQVLSARLIAITAIFLLSYHFIRIDLLGGDSGNRFIQAGIESGYTIAHIQERQHVLSTRELATNHVTAQKTILLYGAKWIPVNNESWVFCSEISLWCQKNGNLYVSVQTPKVDLFKAWTEQGFRIVAWDGRKSHLVRSGEKWRDYVEVVDLEDFFGEPIKGRLFQ